MPVAFDPKKHHRRSIRLEGYDYTQAGAYFVTIVTWQRQCLFGDVVNKAMALNEAGKIVAWEWKNLALAFKFVELGVFCVMPNHCHGVLLLRDPHVISGTVGATRQGVSDTISDNASFPNSTLVGPDGSPLLPNGPKPASLGAIIGQFKSRVTKRLWKIQKFAGTPIWQRNYYERIIRNEREMDAIGRYIEANPAMWDGDEENPHSLT